MKKCKHTKCPEGYIQWHAWAEKKMKKHTCLRCPICGKFAIWKRSSTLIKKIGKIGLKNATALKKVENYLDLLI